MGENTFTFTGLMSEEPKNEQTVTTVKVPRHEYALLVAAKARLDMVEKLVDSLESYKLCEMMKVLFSDIHEEEK